MIVAAGLAWLHLCGIATASFTKTPAAPAMTISSATLAAPASLSAVRGSCTPVVGPRSVNLSWGASSSTFTDGYQIFRSVVNNGPYLSLANVGTTPTTYTDSTVLAATTYYYVVQAKKSLWRSANSPQASVTTPNGVTCL